MGEIYLHHALVNDGVSTGFADHQIGPLYNDNGHKEGCVTGVLQNLTLGVCLQHKTTTPFNPGPSPWALKQSYNHNRVSHDLSV